MGHLSAWVGLMIGFWNTEWYEWVTKSYTPGKSYAAGTSAIKMCVLIMLYRFIQTHFWILRTDNKSSTKHIMGAELRYEEHARQLGCIKGLIFATTMEQFHSSVGTTPRPSPSSSLCVVALLCNRFQLLCSHLPKWTSTNRGKQSAAQFNWAEQGQVWKQTKTKGYVSEA